MAPTELDFDSYEVLERRLWIGDRWVPTSLIITPIVVFIFLVVLFTALRKRMGQRTIVTVHTLQRTNNPPMETMAPQPGTYYVATVVPNQNATYGQQPPAFPPSTYAAPPANQGPAFPTPGYSAPPYQGQTYHEQTNMPQQPPANRPIDDGIEELK